MESSSTNTEAGVGDQSTNGVAHDMMKVHLPFPTRSKSESETTTMESNSPVVAAEPKGGPPIFVSKLPPEIRNMIYHLVLVAGNEVNVSPASIRAMTGLLKVCSQIREEASLIFYSQNRFHLNMDVSSLDNCVSLEWLRSVGKINAHSLSNLAICLHDGKMHDWVEALSEDELMDDSVDPIDTFKPCSQSAQLLVKTLLSLHVCLKGMDPCSNCQPELPGSGQTILMPDLRNLAHVLRGKVLSAGFRKGKRIMFQKLIATKLDMECSPSMETKDFLDLARAAKTKKMDDAEGWHGGDCPC